MELVRMMCKVEGQTSYNWANIRANKVARGILSPFQAKDFQLAYAIA